MNRVKLSRTKDILVSLVVLFLLALFYSPLRANDTALYEKLNTFGAVFLSNLNRYTYHLY